jgi:hypothetical protein
LSYGILQPPPLLFVAFVVLKLDDEKFFFSKLLFLDANVRPYAFKEVEFCMVSPVTEASPYGEGPFFFNFLL